jgi:hypothetical protein
MKNVLAAVALIIGLTITSAAPAAAQAPCLVTERGLSFQQWLQICGPQVAQTCSMLPMQGPACMQSVAQAEYQTYVRSQYVSMACQPYQAGQRQCINGYVATCNGSMFITSAQQC